MIERCRKFAFGSAIAFVFAISVQLSPAAQAINASGPPKPSPTVPFVGCKSDGQVGPLKSPIGRRKVVSLPAKSVQQLAYYKAEYGAGALAPRDWYCFSTYGSNGSTLYISPTPPNPADLFSTTWKGIAGPAIQISSSIGDTSGRFEVAQIIARVFPGYKEFVRNVIEEGIEPASSFPFGPYPKDKLTYRSPKIVEYETPADTDGLGTNSRLQKSADPIRGTAILVGQVPDLVLLSVRLPPQQRNLTRIIMQQVEYDAAHPTKSN